MAKCKVRKQKKSKGVKIRERKMLVDQPEGLAGRKSPADDQTRVEYAK